jgi:hypothetical protein
MKKGKKEEEREERKERKKDEKRKKKKGEKKVSWRQTDVIQALQKTIWVLMDLGTL